MHHRLLVAALEIAHPGLHLVERLADAGDVTVAEDAKHAAEQRLPPAVTFRELDAQKFHERLCHRGSHSSV